MGLNETAQDFPTSQGKSEWTSDIKWHQTNVSDQEPSTGHKWKGKSSENNKQEKIKIIKFDYDNFIIEM